MRRLSWLTPLLLVAGIIGITVTPQVIAAALPTTTTMALSPNPVNTGASYTLSINVRSGATPATGSVLISSSSSDGSHSELVPLTNGAYISKRNIGGGPRR